MSFFTINNKTATLAQFLVFSIGNVIAWPLCFWVLYSAGQALTGDVIGGYAFSLFVAVAGKIVTLD